MHFVSVPVTIVAASIAPLVLTPTANVIKAKLTDVASPVRPAKSAFAVFGSVDVVSFVTCLVLPYLHAVPMLLIVFPLALIHGPIVVDVLSMPIGLILAPLTHIYVTIAVDQPTKAIGLAATPLALIERTIEPDLDTLTLSRRYR